MSNIAFIGLGAMGRRMAAHLVKDHSVTVYNRSPEPADKLKALGAQIASSPAEAAKGADFIITMVADDKAARAVWLGEQGALAGAGPDAVLLESSTVTPEWMIDLNEAAKCRAVIDAPVAGTLPQAEGATLAYFLGGSEDAVEKSKPILQLMGDKIFHIGPSTHGARIKLVINSLFAVQVALFGELLGSLQRTGVDPRKAFELLSKLPMTSPAAAGAVGLMLAGNNESKFPVRLVEKDLRYAVATAGELPVVEAARGAYERAMEAGHGDLNISAVGLNYLS